MKKTFLFMAALLTAALLSANNATDDKTAVSKEFRDGVLYIIRDGKAYNALGTEVR